MAKPKLTLYVDTVSPFAYLAFYVIMVSEIFCDSVLPVDLPALSRISPSLQFFSYP